MFCHATVGLINECLIFVMTALILLLLCPNGNELLLRGNSTAKDDGSSSEAIKVHLKKQQP